MPQKALQPLLFLSCLACSTAADNTDPASGGSGAIANTSTATATAGRPGGVSGAGAPAARSGAAGQARAAAGSGASTSPTASGTGPSPDTSASAGSGGRPSTPGGAAAGSGAAGGPAAPPPLDCGEEGWAVENHGDPKNRVNYLILADGYTKETVETTLKTHIDAALKRRFEHESGEPYGRYRNFVNICVMKAISQTDGIGKGPTAFDGGNGGDRLAAVNEQKVNAYIKEKVPASFEVDWRAVVLNQGRRVSS